MGDEFDWDSDEWEAKVMEEEKGKYLALDGFAPAGVGYGNVKEDTAEKAKKKKGDDTCGSADGANSAGADGAEAAKD
ncbi:hypothetical protein CJ030_MR5G025129 [Morella rubra]|uniref:Uncharacterized protein n=1 Tax=Morella rubra TaxID=262757 RepID=A0A6A1VHX0_9ROSI|nr:hypothetical protein CJ030_MR5G025129 [Morella rubra]